ncbi:Uncharacterized protein Fot_56203 [Forsythia ovata]|uniref:Uncharacterized protein n=1 Tax=Forsythia ovata TaxID=205694 RepID=A0ABD1P309_9LAMI
MRKVVVGRKLVEGGNGVDFWGGGVEFTGSGADAGEGYDLEGLGVGAGTGVGLVERATGDGDGVDVPFLNRGPTVGSDGGVPHIEDVPQVDNNPLDEEENALAQDEKRMVLDGGVGKDDFF